MKDRKPKMQVIRTLAKNAYDSLALLLTSLLLLCGLYVTLASAEEKLLIGSEYIALEWPGFPKAQADLLKDTGIPTAKHYVEIVQWEATQMDLKGPINFSRFDWFVKEFQLAGIKDLTICLKSRHRTASKDYTWDHSPKPEYMEHYKKWVQSIVERYDMDGVNDMPGLIAPVRHYEIGNEFSSYEPGSAANYIEMLKLAYDTIHATYNGKAELLVGHAAFMMMNVFKDNPTPEEYKNAFGTSPILNDGLNRHGYDDIIYVLSHPETFDVVNVHALAYPDEIKQMVDFIEYAIKNLIPEEARQHYIAHPKSIIISDTMTNPFIAFGPANVCNKTPNVMGKMIHPAVESDRCRIAAYFQKLIDQDQETTKWVQGFAAEDNAKKIIISAAIEPRYIGQKMILKGVKVINTAFTYDLYYQKMPSFAGSAGNCAWAGQTDFLKTDPITKKGEARAGLYALKQIVTFLKGYDSVVDLTPQSVTKGTLYENVRIYEVRKNNFIGWLMWYEPTKVYLPGEAVPTITLPVQYNASVALNVEKSISKIDPLTRQPLVEKMVWQTNNNGILAMELTPTPYFVTVKSSEK